MEPEEILFGIGKYSISADELEFDDDKNITRVKPSNKNFDLLGDMLFDKQETALKFLEIEMDKLKSEFGDDLKIYKDIPYEHTSQFQADNTLIYLVNTPKEKNSYTGYGYVYSKFN